MLHALLLKGLLHGDSLCRQRALHLLQACVSEDCAPQVRDSDSCKLSGLKSGLQSLAIVQGTTSLKFDGTAQHRLSGSIHACLGWY